MRSKNSKIGIFLFNPVISAFRSYRDIREPFSLTILYFWFLIFGVAFSALREEADSFRYVEMFYSESQYTYNQYISIIGEYFTFNSNIKDIYTLSVNFLVGRFSNNYHWTYLIYAAVFGLFLIKSLKCLLKYTIDYKWAFYALLFMFYYSNPIYNINGVRFWTSAWIGVFVALQLFEEKNYKYLPLLILMPLIHGSSSIWIFVMAIAFFLARYQKICIVWYIASSFVSAVSYLNLLGDYSYLLPSFMQQQIWAYTESEIAQTRLAGQTIYGAAYADFLIALPGYFRIALTYLLLFNVGSINKNEHNKWLFSIYLMLSATTNFLSSIPSANRFMTLTIPFFVIVWAQNYGTMKKYNKILLLVPVIYAYSLLYWFRHMIGATEIWLYILPAPLIVFKYLFFA